MLIAVVHTLDSPCGCAKAVATGLNALGHEVYFVDSEEIGLMAGEISRRCDLVIDHTDTFYKSGFLRPFVRWILEEYGARIVGSDARACLLADNKIAAKECLASAGIPVPPGVTVTSVNDKLPSWLKPPLVLKPSFEHMSRGLGFAETDDEIHTGIAELIARFRQSVLVESFISGREIAVSLLEEENGLKMLPPLEWLVQSGNSGMLTEGFKQADVPNERQDMIKADLPPDLAADLEKYSCLAFRTLGLRDYARFDIRLSPNGTFYFLEANTTPSLEPLEALAVSAGWEEMDYISLVAKLLSAAMRRYGSRQFDQERKTIIDLPSGQINILIPEGVHRPPASSHELARLLDIQKGERVLDLGCGTGLLAIAAARLGAGHVVAIDIDPRALEATRENALANGVEEKIEVIAGSWYEGLNVNYFDDAGKFDVIIAAPPQTPGLYPFGPRYGGPDGMKHVITILQGSSLFLKPDCGRLWLMAISLANPSELFRQLNNYFYNISLVHETDRSFTSSEYELLHEGIINHFLDLRLSGRSDFKDAGKDRYIFRNLFICARKVRMR